MQTPLFPTAFSMQPRALSTLPRLLPALAAAAFLQLASLGAPPAAVAGEVYVYVDQDGTMHFTNTPTDARFKQFKPRAPIGRMTHPRTVKPVRLSSGQLDDTISRHSRRHRIDPALLRAVIKAESDFDPQAVSRAGAMGLMQLMPHTAVRMDVRNPYDPEENVGGGARYLRYLLDRFNGNVPLALAAYNAGEHRVERNWALPPIEETRNYVTKVLRFYHAFLSTESEALMRSAGGVAAFRPTLSFSPAAGG